MKSLATTNKEMSFMTDLRQGGTERHRICHIITTENSEETRCIRSLRDIYESCEILFPLQETGN